MSMAETGAYDLYLYRFASTSSKNESLAACDQLFFSLLLTADENTQVISIVYTLSFLTTSYFIDLVIRVD
jgi:hypothetical protein